MATPNGTRPRPVQLTFGTSDRVEDIVGKIEFATDISAKARLAYNILMKHPGMVSFHSDYVMDNEGKVTLIGVSMNVKGPGTQEQRENSENLGDSLDKPLQ